MRYITVEGLSFQYDAEPVLDNIHYHLDSGEFVTLPGENGAAKSTLIKATLGILKPKKGIVTISDINKDGKKLRMAYLPQQIASFNAGFPSTVYEFVKSSVFGTCYQSTHVQGKNLLILQTFRHILRHDSLCKTLDCCCFTYTRLTDKHRIVLGLT